jgi:hypothetical protein|tara:strand:- start:351 stop:503 length:153 start_codon:yes stop_codon:yes gene_type:complete
MALLELGPDIKGNQRQSQARRQHREEAIRHPRAQWMVHQHGISALRRRKY